MPAPTIATYQLASLPARRLTTSRPTTTTTTTTSVTTSLLKAKMGTHKSVVKSVLRGGSSIELVIDQLSEVDEAHVIAMLQTARTRPGQEKPVAWELSTGVVSTVPVAAS